MIDTLTYRFFITMSFQVCRKNSVYMITTFCLIIKLQSLFIFLVFHNCTGSLTLCNIKFYLSICIAQWNNSVIIISHIFLLIFPFSYRTFHFLTRTSMVLVKLTLYFRTGQDQDNFPFIFQCVWVGEREQQFLSLFGLWC